MSVLHDILLGAYGGLWRAAVPVLKRHKRLKDGFAERLVPDDWLPEGWRATLAAPGQPLAGPCAPRLPDAEPCAHVAAASSCSGALTAASSSTGALSAASSSTGALSAASSSTGALSAAPLRVWVQAASGGEAGLVRELLPALARQLGENSALRERGMSVLCTTMTRQGRDVLDSLPSEFFNSANPSLPPVTRLSRFFPLDAPAFMAKAFSLFAPDAVVLLETELWPGLMAEAKKRGVPVCVLNARMTEKSFSAYGKTPGFWRALAPQTVCAISQGDAERFSALFGTESTVMENIKFDRALHEAQHVPGKAPSACQAEGAAAAKPVVAFVSVREEEEADIDKAIRALLENGAVRVAVAPRHMHRVPFWKAAAASYTQEYGVSVLLRSEQAQAGEGAAAHNARCVLWDTFGELPALYRMAQAVFVGGSLAPLGGQNFLEPLSFGLCPVVGPHITNFLWVGEALFTEGLAVRIADAEELVPALLGRIAARQNDGLSAGQEAGQEAGQDGTRNGTPESEHVRSRFLAWLEPRTGGSAYAAKVVCGVLSKSGTATGGVVAS